MKKRIIAICACALALGATATEVKIATREWVIKQLATSGIRVSTATTTHNTNGTFTVSGPFTSDTVTNCVELYLTFTEPAIVSSAMPVVRGQQLRSAAINDNKIQITLTAGGWWDNTRTREFTFNFGGGYTFTWPGGELPEVPSSEHVCELDADCNCKGYNKPALTYPDDYPEEYRLFDDADFEEVHFGNIISWIDAASWADQTTVAGKTRYWITDINDNRFNLEQIGKTDLWRNAVAEVKNKINERMTECCMAYRDSFPCNRTNPQHSWQTTTCGSYSWSVCGHNPAHTQGTEGHEYPGSTYNASWHSCKCGHKTEAHGTLVASGSRTPTYNEDEKETGWTQTMECPKGCGYSETKTHTHHFTNCGTCDAGDSCSTVCTGCNGEHVFGEATVTGVKEHDKCAVCECTMCEGCNAHPPADDITKHAGWMPCSKDVEEDNDDGTANGGHCQCQCLVFGHDARTEHDYQLSAGMADREQITDHTAPARAKTYHYQILGQCTRCGQYKKQLEVHDWPSDPTEYKYVSDSVCAWLYECEQCFQKKRDETHGHELGDAIVHEAITVSGSPKCRQKKQCEHCKTYINDDTGDHVLGEGCKCANGCGYQFEHSYSQDACGNRVCSNCGAYQYSQESHSGYMSGGTYSAAGHQCACGVKPDVPHVMGTPVEVSRVGWIVTYRDTCTACPFYREWTVDANPCKNGHVGLPDACGCMCGYYSPTSHVATAKSLHHWTEGGTNNNPECICDCGNAHQFKDEDTYTRNRFPQYTNVVQCLGICWACKERDSNDRIVSAEDHQPIAAGYQAGAARCGCRCGKVKSTLYEKFHYRNSGGVGGLPSCRCYGENARASGATAGSYHFRDPSACPNVCSVVVNGERHIAASHDKVYAPGFVKADVKAHEVKDWGTSCGCKCGLYDATNWTEWNGKMDFHRQAVSCCCGCPGKKHFPIARSNCTRLCGGNCTGLASDDVWGQHSGASYDPAYHDPSDVACKCQCEYFSGASAPDKFHSLTNSSKRCYCIGLHKHKFPHPRADCTGICSICGNGHQYAVAPSAPNEPGQHDWDGLNCKCNCPEAKLWPGGHRFADNACVCTCGEQTRGHVYQQHSKTQTGTHTCPSCGNTITEYHIVYKCKRCGDVWDGVDTEEGHASNCGEGDGGGGDSGTYENYCEKHNRYYDLECPDCKDEDEGGGGAGGGFGGFTGGGGGYRDI